MFPVPHPVKGELANRRITTRSVAERYGCTESFAGRVINGWQPAPHRFRAFLAEILDMPEEELFHDTSVEVAS